LGCGRAKEGTGIRIGGKKGPKSVMSSGTRSDTRNTARHTVRGRKRDLPGRTFRNVAEGALVPAGARPIDFAPQELREGPRGGGAMILSQPFATVETQYAEGGKETEAKPHEAHG